MNVSKNCFVAGMVAAMLARFSLCVELIYVNSAWAGFQILQCKVTCVPLLGRALFVRMLAIIVHETILLEKATKVNVSG